MSLLATRTSARHGREPSPSTATSRTRRVIRRLRPTEIGVFFSIASLLYIAVAIAAAVRDVHFGDAETRLNQAEAVVFASDPHVGAVGFVFGPLPSLALVPFLPLQTLWPVLEHDNIFGGVESALFMAGALAITLSTLRDIGVRRVTRILLTALFGLSPFIIVFGSNGMAEAPMTFFLALATRSLLRWISDPESARYRCLGTCGLALGAAYLCRFEPLAAGVAVIALVAGVSWYRHGGRAAGIESRRWAALDAALVGLPFVATVVVLAAISKVLVGAWLADASNNQAQVDASRGRLDALFGHTFGSRGHFLLTQMVATEPLFPAALGLGLIVLLVRRDLRVLAPVAVLGAVLFADVAVFFKGGNFGFLRYYISIVPLTVLLVGLFIAPKQEVRTRPVLLVDKPPPWRAVIGVVVVAYAFATCAPIFHDRNIAGQEYRYYLALLHPAQARALQDSGDVYIMDNARQAAQAIDALHAPKGSILTDSANSFAVQTMTAQRSVFLGNADRKWERALAAPSLFGVKYLLVTDAGSAHGDALEQAYPQLTQGGGTIARLIGDFPSKTSPSFKLYELLPDAPGATGIEG